ncbi:hypothetical protein VUN82_10855 [Micrococcaceae bacterium Sec5.1]
MGKRRKRPRRQLDARGRIQYGIFAAGVSGAVVISNFDGMLLPIVMSGLALLIAVAGRRTAFPK